MNFLLGIVVAQSQGLMPRQRARGLDQNPRSALSRELFPETARIWDKALGKLKAAGVAASVTPALLISSVMLPRDPEAALACGNGELRLLPISVDGTSPFKKGKPFVAAPTDHCPHFVELTRK